MKTLHLPLKAKWYDMIESGEKPEDYREFKPYWMKRICKHVKNGRCTRVNFCPGCMHVVYVPTDITHVCFSYGYTKRRMTYEVETIKVGIGKPEWGAPTNRKVFVIKLGRRAK